MVVRQQISLPIGQHQSPMIVIGREIQRFLANWPSIVKCIEHWTQYDRHRPEKIETNPKILKRIDPQTSKSAKGESDVPWINQFDDKSLQMSQKHRKMAGKSPKKNDLEDQTKFEMIWKPPNVMKLAGKWHEFLKKRPKCLEIEEKMTTKWPKRPK